MAECVLCISVVAFSEKVFQQISGTAIGTKFATPYADINMDKVEIEFLQVQKFEPVV